MSQTQKDRRQILTLLPLLAAGCAAPQLKSRATPAADKGPSSPFPSSLMDQIVVFAIDTTGSLSPRSTTPAAVRQIGRASCRERV